MRRSPNIFKKIFKKIFRIFYGFPHQMRTKSHNYIMILSSGGGGGEQLAAQSWRMRASYTFIEQLAGSNQEHSIHS